MANSALFTARQAVDRYGIDRHPTPFTANVRKPTDEAARSPYPVFFSATNDRHLCLKH